MTAAANDTWIENSLARIETLEAQRERLAATGQTARLAEIDEEIKGLYEALESVASDDDSDDEPANEAVAAPVAAWPMAAAPMAAVASPQPMMDMGPPPSSDYSTPIAFDDGDAKPRSALPLVLAGLLVVGGGAGALWLMNRGQPEDAKPAPSGPATVIKSGSILDDTSEPNVAKGGDADRTSGTIFKERPRSNEPPPPANRGGSRPASERPAKADEGDDRKITFEKGKDPLGGVE